MKLPANAMNLAILAAVGLGGYLFYKKVLGPLGAGLTKTGEAIGGGFFDFLHSYNPATDTFYTVSFYGQPNHAIRADTVGSDGKFAYAGVKYQMKTDSSGKKFAVAI